ncbi:MAG TPA: hypothetical protein VJ816_05585 [Gemmatimonadales bacterium]|nr:hypothetical protein [Gemmatimonadales bacterium]
MPVAALLLAASLLQTQSVTGTRYTFNMITDDDSTAGVVREDGRRARIDFFRKNASDDYVLVLDGGRRVVSIHPREGEYGMTDDSTFSRVAAIGLRAVSATGVVRFRVRDMHVSSRRLGAGDRVAGLETERFRMIQEFTVGVSAFGLPGETMHQVVVTDYWVSRSVRLVPNPIIDLVSTITSILGQTDPEFTQRSNVQRQDLFTGTPLRIVVTAHTLEEPNKVTTQRIEITALERDSFDRSLWDIPAGLRQRQGEFSWHF